MLSQQEMFDEENSDSSDDKNVCRFLTDLSKNEFTFSDDNEKLTTVFRGLYSHKWNDFFRGDMELTADHIKNMKTNFEDNVVGTDLAVDYGHNAFDKAAGWIKSVDTGKSGNDLFLTVEWTPEGAKSIRDKEYRYFSAEFSMNYMDAKSGEKGHTLLGGGLTNRPFLKNLKPVLHSQKTKKKEKEQMDTISMETHKLEIETRNQKIDSLQSEIKKFSDLQDTVKKLSDESAAKDTEIETLKQAAKKAEKEIQFNDLLHAGKLNLAQKEAFMTGDVVALSQSIEKPNLSKPDNATIPEGETVSLSEADRLNARKFGMTDKEWVEAEAFKKAGGSYSLITK